MFLILVAIWLFGQQVTKFKLQYLLFFVQVAKMAVSIANLEDHLQKMRFKVG